MHELFVDVVIRIPDEELSDRELMARMKSEGHVDPQIAYGIFAYRKRFNPGIDAFEFNKIFNQVDPNPHTTRKTVPFYPTHRDILLDKLCCVKREEGNIRIVWEFGMTGGQPAHLFDDRFIPLDSEKNKEAQP